MKNSPFSAILLTVPTAILLTLLLVVSLWSLGLCWSYVSKARELRKFKTEERAIVYRQNAINALINDTLEYSKKNPNPALDQILESVGVNKALRAAQAGPNKPANTK